MLQCLEWEPCGSFALNNGYSAHDESGQNQPNLLKDLRDAALPPNPLKTILNRPSVTHFLTVGSSFSFSFSIVTAFWLSECMQYLMLFIHHCKHSLSAIQQYAHQSIAIWIKGNYYAHHHSWKLSGICNGLVLKGIYQSTYSCIQNSLQPVQQLICFACNNMGLASLRIKNWNGLV